VIPMAPEIGVAADLLGVRSEQPEASSQTATRPAIIAPALAAIKAAPSVSPRAEPTRASLRPKDSSPARSLKIVNASGSALNALKVVGDGKSAELWKQVDPDQSVTLRLPAFRSCTVAIVATMADTDERKVTSKTSAR
jgi:hypothetical protein